MNAPDLMAALNTVEEDHQLVLDKVRALRETVSYLLEPDQADAPLVLDRLRQIHQFLDTRFECHMAEEETTLFPVLEQHAPQGAELVARLRQEHAEIRRRREEFGNCLEIADELEDRPPPMVLRDLLAYGWELWELLDNHAHAETRAVHQCVAQSLAPNGSLAPSH